MKYFSIQELTDFCSAFFTHRGVAAENARYISELLVLGEAMGYESHGLLALEEFNTELDRRVDPAQEPSIISNSGATALIDGNGGIGHLSVKLAKELAVKKAREYGVALVAARHLGWIAALGR